MADKIILEKSFDKQTSVKQRQVMCLENSKFTLNYPSKRNTDLIHL